MKKEIIYIIALVFLLISCDKRKDIFKNGNKAITAKVYGTNYHSQFTETINGNYIIDTVKRRIGYRFKLNSVDEIDEIKVVFNGPGDLYYKGIQVNALDTLKVNINENAGFHWKPSSTGLQNISLDLVDSYDITTRIKFELVVFENMTPIIDWELLDINNLNNLDKQFKVNGNDRDSKWGGKIMYYEYVINTDTTLYTQNNMSYVFPSEDTYYISVRAFDNDSTWSNLYVNANYIID